MIDQAFGLLMGGYAEDAAEAFSKCLLSEPKEARIYRGRGIAYFQLKKWKLAVDDFRNARELDAEDPANWTGLAVSLVMDSRIYEAIDVYDSLLANKPRFIGARIQLAMLYYRLGAISKGHYQLDTALDSGPSPSERMRIENLKKEQLDLDKKRYYRPDFEALRKQD